MAKTYYGYKDRETKDIFDWADTGTKISQAIEKEAKSRETRKQDFITANQTFERNITSKIPRSQDASLNNQILAALNTQLDAYYADYKRFTSGDIPENEWVQIRQNRQDGLNNYLGLMQDYATMADEKLKRQVNRESQTWEGQSMSQIQGFNDYSKWQMVTDENGTSYMNKVDENGNLIEGPGSRVSLSIARKQVGTYYDKYNLDAGVKKAVGRFGKTKLAIMKKGVKTREAITNNPQWKSALENISKSELGNPFNRLSVLTEDMGGNVEFVYSEAEAGIDDDGTYKVYMKQDPISKLNEPQFTEEQDKAIYDLFEDMVLTQSNIIEEGYQKTIRPKAKWEYDLRRDKNKQKELYRAIKGMLNSDDPTEWETAINDVGALSSVRGGGKLTVVHGVNGPEFNFIDSDGESSTIAIDPNDKEKTMRTLFVQFGGSDENFRGFFNQYGTPSKINNPKEGSDYSYSVQRRDEMKKEEILKVRNDLLKERSKLVSTDEKVDITQDQSYKDLTEEIKKYDELLGVNTTGGNPR